MSQTPSSRSWQSSLSQPHTTGASMEQLPSASHAPSPASVTQLAPHGRPLHGEASAPPLAEVVELELGAPPLPASVPLLASPVPVPLLAVDPEAPAAPAPVAAASSLRSVLPPQAASQTIANGRPARQRSKLMARASPSLRTRATRSVGMLLRRYQGREGVGCCRSRGPGRADTDATTRRALDCCARDGVHRISDDHGAAPAAARDVVGAAQRGSDLRG